MYQSSADQPPPKQLEAFTGEDDASIPTTTVPTIPDHFPDHPVIKILSPAFFGYSCERRIKEKEAGPYIGIDSLSFQFIDDRGNKLPGLELTFNNKFASQHKIPLRWSCYGGAVGMAIYAGYDWWYHRQDERLLVFLMVLRFAGFLPCLLCAGSLTHTRTYWDVYKRRRILTLLSMLLGILIIVYSYATGGANQGTFALYLALLFFLTPLPFKVALTIASIMWAAYLPCLLVAGDDQKAESVVDLILDWDVLQAWSNLLASLVLYSCLRYVQVRYLADDTIKVAFLSRNRNAAHEEREHASQLLLSCLPEEIIGQLEQTLQYGAPFGASGAPKGASDSAFARHHDSVTVLFCQVCNIPAITAILDEGLGHQVCFFFPTIYSLGLFVSSSSSSSSSSFDYFLLTFNYFPPNFVAVVVLSRTDRKHWLSF
jgi:hypothetical protein